MYKCLETFISFLINTCNCVSKTIGNLSQTEIKKLTDKINIAKVVFYEKLKETNFSHFIWKPTKMN